MLAMSPAKIVYHQIYTTLTVLLLATGPASPAGPENLDDGAGIEVAARWATVGAVGKAVLRFEPDGKGMPQAAGIEVPISVPSRAEVNLPAPGIWRVRLVCQGYWGEEKAVTVAPSTIQTVSLRLFPAAQIQGALALPSTARTPESIVVDFVETPRYGPRDSESVPEGSATCEVADAQADCTVPAGQLDLRFHTPGLAPVYLWSVDIKAGQTRHVGPLRLVEGGSVIGWMQNEDGQPQKDIAVRLAAAVALELSDPILSQRLERQQFEATTNERGFFQLTGLPAGTFRLSATGEGYTIAEPQELIVVEGTGEERLGSPVTLVPPAIYEIVLEPPLDPAGKLWKLEIFQLGEGHYVDRQIQGVASKAGAWRQEGLDPGAYFLQVFDHGGSRWVGEEVHVDARTPVHVVEIPVVEVTGTVTHNGEAVPGTLSLVGKKSQVRLEVDDAGDFAGFLPDEKRFGVILAPSELQGLGTSLVLEPVELEQREGRKAVLDIKVPNTRLEGDVVDGGSHFVRGARVRLMAFGVRQQHSLTKTDGDGAFDFWGIPPGDVLVGATSTAGESEKVLVHLEEDMVPPRLRLQLLENMRLSGQVVSLNGPLAGAHILVWPDMGSYNVSFTDTGTDVDGTFQIDVQKTARWINLMVRAPGFATRLVRESVSPKGSIIVSMDKDGGDVVLELPSVLSGPEADSDVSSPPPTPLLYHEGVVIPTSILRMLSPSVRRNEALLGHMILSNLESGEYSLCVGPEAFTALREETQPSPAHCARGFLSAGGVLELSLSEQAEGSG